MGCYECSSFEEKKSTKKNDKCIAGIFESLVSTAIEHIGDIQNYTNLEMEEIVESWGNRVKI